MLLSDFLKIDSRLTIPYLQKAFIWTVEKLRLDPSLLLIRLNGRVRFGDWQNPFLNALGSEFQIRRINEVMNGKIAGEPLFKSFALAGECLVGQADKPLENWGFDSSITESCSYSGNRWAILEKTLENLDSRISLGFLNVYLYPYLVRHANESNPHDTRHVYDIQAMIDMYGIDNLVIDNTLMMPVGLVAKSFAEDDMLNIAASQTLLALAVKMINMYNNNMQSLGLQGDGGDIAQVKPYNFAVQTSNGGFSYGII